MGEDYLRAAAENAVSLYTTVEAHFCEMIITIYIVSQIIFWFMKKKNYHKFASVQK